MRKTALCAVLSATIVAFIATFANAGSPLWDLNPGSGDWNTASNWTPMTVPNGSADTATFAASNTTSVSISASTEVDGITFTPDAPSFTITASPNLALHFNGTGITNNSGTVQNFVTAIDTSARDTGVIFFINSATAGSSTTFTNDPGGVDGRRVTEFFNTSSAANGTFINNGGTAFPTQYGGETKFFDSSTAANGNFTNNGTMSLGAGSTEFDDNSTAGNGTFVNNGGAFDPFHPGSGFTRFTGLSTAANGKFINNGGTVSGAVGGATIFSHFLPDAATAGNGTFINNGGTASGASGGVTEFSIVSTADKGIFTNNGGTANGAGGGATEFTFSSTAGSGTFTNNGGTVSGAGGGFTNFLHNSTAANGTFTNNGGVVSGAGGGYTRFTFTSTAGNATLIAAGGTGGGEGGAILFEQQSTGGTSRVEVFSNGNLDISGHTNLPHRTLPMTVGSIEGDGNVFLGANSLIVGSNNLSTTFSGVIQDGGRNGGNGGSLTKIGSGTLALTGANTYTGNTRINDGELLVDGSIRSNTFVNQHSTLAGTGTINANVTNHVGTVSPGSELGTLTVNNYTQTGGNLVINIAGPNTGQFSVLNVLDNASLNSGMLNPALLNGFIPAIGDQFTFLNYDSVFGSLFIHDRNIDSVAEHWEVNFQPTLATLTVAAGNVPVPDHGSTLLLMTLSLLGLVTCQWRSMRK